MSVDPQTAAAHADHEGTTYHFCSTGCHDTFTADPSEYVPTKAGAAQH